MVNEPVLLGLERGHVAVAVRVLLDLLQRLYAGAEVRKERRVRGRSGGKAQFTQQVIIVEIVVTRGKRSGTHDSKAQNTRAKVRRHDCPCLACPVT